MPEYLRILLEIRGDFLAERIPNAGGHTKNFNKVETNTNFALRANERGRRGLKSMKVIGGKELSGTVDVFPSENYTHRHVVALSLSPGKSKILNPLVNSKTLLTRKGCEAFGVRVEEENKGWVFEGKEDLAGPFDPLECDTSWQTVGMLMPMSLVAEGRCSFAGNSRMLRDSAVSLRRMLASKSIEVRGRGLPSIQGPALKGGQIRIRNADAHLASGLMLVSPRAESEVGINFTGSLKPSNSAIAMTLDIMRRMGIETEEVGKKGELRIPAPQSYHPSEVTIEGSFLIGGLVLVAAAVSRSVIRVAGLNPNGLQPEIKLIEGLRQFGANVRVGEDFVQIDARDATGLPMTMKAAESQLLFPASVLASFTDKWSTFTEFPYGKGDLPHDLRMLMIELNKVGVEVVYDEKNLYVKGGDLKPATLSSHADDFVSMACTCLALGIQNGLEIANVEYTSPYFMAFVELVRGLGADIEVQEGGPSGEAESNSLSTE